jgi:hypothetical protein
MAATATKTKTGVAAVDIQDVEEQKVHELFGGEVVTEGLIGTGFTYRHDWGNKHGSWKLFLNWGAITANSRVFVAIGEGAAGGPPAGKFIGDAKYTLMNVAPTNGQVGIWVNIDWGSDIRIYVDYLVVTP